jgi:hypothetical protein
MMNIALQIGISFAFLMANVLVILLILDLNRRRGGSRHEGSAKGSVEPAAQSQAGQSDEASSRSEPSGELPASEILGWEFEYARTTASEAMSDRHTMINFYLVVFGALGTGLLLVLGGLSSQMSLPAALGTALLWLLCIVGWLYFLKLIRLRQAWYGSAMAMNQIKKFYINHSRDFEPDELRQAFLFKPETLPSPDKAWNVFFYSAMLIALLDSAAYVAGGILLGWNTGQTMELTPSVLGLLALFGLILFAFHVRMYFAFLHQ